MYKWYSIVHDMMVQLRIGHTVRCWRFMIYTKLPWGRRWTTKKMHTARQHTVTVPQYRVQCTVWNTVHRTPYHTYQLPGVQEYSIEKIFARIWASVENNESVVSTILMLKILSSKTASEWISSEYDTHVEAAIVRKCKCTSKQYFNLSILPAAVQEQDHWVSISSQ